MFALLFTLFVVVAAVAVHAVVVVVVPLVVVLVVVVALVVVLVVVVALVVVLVVVALVVVLGQHGIFSVLVLSVAILVQPASPTAW